MDALVFTVSLLSSRLQTDHDWGPKLQIFLPDDDAFEASKATLDDALGPNPRSQNWHRRTRSCL